MTVEETEVPEQYLVFVPASQLYDVERDEEIPFPGNHQGESS
jgi:hypothetical protein